MRISQLCNSLLSQSLVLNRVWYWIVQSVCYNLLWYFCITYPKSRQKSRLLASSLLLLVQIALVERIITSYNLMMMLVLVISGNIIAALLIKLKQYTYGNNGIQAYFPCWLLLIWISFTLYIYPVIWNYRTHFIAIGCIMFPCFICVYYFAVTQQAIFIRSSKIKSLIWAGSLHGILFTVLTFILSAHEYIYTEVLS